MENETVLLVLTGIQTAIVALSFPILIWQLKQHNDGQHFEAFSRAVEDYQRITELLLERPHLNLSFYSSNIDFKKLAESEKDFYNYIGLALGFIERIFLLYKKGWVDRSIWASWERWLVESWLCADLFSVFWRNEGRYFSSDFAIYIEGKCGGLGHSNLSES